MHRHTIPIICLVTGILFSPSAVYSKAFDQGKIQAPNIYNFINFTAWSQTESSPKITESLDICLFGEDGITDELSRLNNVYIKEKKVGVKMTDLTSELEFCHVVYISPDQSGSDQDLLQLTSGLPVLTVGNDKQLLDDGEIITLSIVAGKLNINLNMLENAGLDLSSKLLALTSFRDE